jgi:hypothetical protein
MALTFIGETDFVQSAPEQWTQPDWELDTLIVPYSGANINLDAFLDSLEKGQPSDIDPNMLLASWRVSGKLYPVVELSYTGKKNGILPPVRRFYGNPIQTSSSNRDGNSGTIEYYALTSRATFFTYDTPGALGTALDPTGSLTPRYLITNDSTIAPGSPGFADWLAYFFTEAITDTLDSEEIVTNKLWRNEEIKTRYFGPYAFIYHTLGTEAISLYLAGSGYTVGDGLTFSYNGGTANVTVTQVGGGGGIADFSIGSDTISAPIVLIITATGGSGTGARFQFYGT